MSDPLAITYVQSINIQPFDTKFSIPCQKIPILILGNNLQHKRLESKLFQDCLCYTMQMLNTVPEYVKAENVAMDFTSGAGRDSTCQ